MRDRLAIGWIQRGHGTEGYVRVSSYSGETGHIAALRELYVADEVDRRAVEDVREISGGALVKLAGVDSREDAEKLHGAVLWVSREFASPRSEGEFYVGDLCGCEVRRGSTVLGVVDAVVEGGATSLLEVRSTRGERFLVPFVDQYVGEVSVERHVLELREDFEVP